MRRPTPTSTLFPYTTLFRSRGVRWAARTQNVFTALKICGLAVLIGSAFLPGAPSAVRPDATPAALSMHGVRSEEHTSELQSHSDLVCRLLLEKKKRKSQQRL